MRIVTVTGSAAAVVRIWVPLAEGKETAGIEIEGSLPVSGKTVLVRFTTIRPTAPAS